MCQKITEPSSFASIQCGGDRCPVRVLIPHSRYDILVAHGLHHHHLITSFSQHASLIVGTAAIKGQILSAVQPCYELREQLIYHSQMSGARAFREKPIITLLPLVYRALYAIVRPLIGILRLPLGVLLSGMKINLSPVDAFDSDTVEFSFVPHSCFANQDHHIAE